MSEANRWKSLQRWTRCARQLFGIVPSAAGTQRERASRVATFVAAHAAVSTGRVSHDAFYGAALCQPP
ncbi:MAG TPA: hypothetical protein VJV78_39465 [Polyangiales bacterium]|nr:hypothetical protein [Polyangiales bacterium]